MSKVLLEGVKLVELLINFGKILVIVLSVVLDWLWVVFFLFLGVYLGSVFV